MLVVVARSICRWVDRGLLVDRVVIFSPHLGEDNISSSFILLRTATETETRIHREPGRVTWKLTNAIKRSSIRPCSVGF